MTSLLHSNTTDKIVFTPAEVDWESGKGRETRSQIANAHCIIAKAREFQKNKYFYLTDLA